jgi:hypothetical protein
VDGRDKLPLGVDVPGAVTTGLKGGQHKRQIDQAISSSKRTGGEGQGVRAYVAESMPGVCSGLGRVPLNEARGRIGEGPALSEAAYTQTEANPYPKPQQSRNQYSIQVKPLSARPPTHLLKQRLHGPVLAAARVVTRHADLDAQDIRGTKQHSKGSQTCPATKTSAQTKRSSDEDCIKHITTLYTETYP